MSNSTNINGLKLRCGTAASGIGGFEYAAKLLGYENVFAIEKDADCWPILKHHYPNTVIYEDIKTANLEQYKGTIDIFSAGLPCQPFSRAGLRQSDKDERFLFDYFFGLVDQVEPPYVVLENVDGFISLAFDSVCASMEDRGYEIESFTFPSYAVGRDHTRKRVFIIAYHSGDRWQKRFSAALTSGESSKEAKRRRSQTTGLPYLYALDAKSSFNDKSKLRFGQPCLLRTENGISRELHISRRVKQLGNSVDPGLVLNIFSAIELHFLELIHNQDFSPCGCDWKPQRTNGILNRLEVSGKKQPLTATNPTDQLAGENQKSVSDNRRASVLKLSK